MSMITVALSLSGFAGLLARKYWYGWNKTAVGPATTTANLWLLVCAPLSLFVLLLLCFDLYGPDGSISPGNARFVKHLELWVPLGCSAVCFIKAQRLGRALWLAQRDAQNAAPAPAASPSSSPAASSEHDGGAASS